MEKRCKTCGDVKPLDQFYKAAGMKDGHRNDCKACNLAAKHRRYAANPEPTKQRVRDWQRENPERLRNYRRAYRTREDVKRRDKDQRYRRVYGIGLEQYETMLAAQGGGCAICGRPPRDDIALHVDHDHVTGQVRGLLCFDCNPTLGKARNDPAILRAAANYLEAHDPEVQDVVALGRKRAASLARR